MRLEAESHRRDEGSSPGKSLTKPNDGSADHPTNNRRTIQHLSRYLIVVIVGTIMLLTSGWALLALYFDAPIQTSPHLLPLLYFLTLTTIWITLRRRRGIASCLTFTCFGLVWAWWLTIPPSNDRNWQADVALTAHGELQGNKVTLRNIRSCKYRSETDYDVAHYDRTFDLDALKTVDLFLVYWGSPMIAHTMASFGFANGEFVCISIETRKEKDEAYSALRGFFRQYELTYVIADERDLVRLRTNFRNEQVHLYRIRARPEHAKALFLEYLREANELHRKPKWYNALTHNCTTSIRMHAERARGRRTPLDWRVIINGYSDEMLYERASIDTSIPFEELKKRSLINDRARTAPEERFSDEIRQGLPGVNP